MTEAEWLASDDPQAMVQFLCKGDHARKLRLFGCACVRQVWDLLTDASFREAVEVSERFADGDASPAELAAAKRAGGAALERFAHAGLKGPAYCALAAAWSTTRNVPTAAMYPLSVFASAEKRRGQVALLRDIFGNPFAPAAVQPSLITPDVVALARMIYDERAFHRMPELAALLEAAGEGWEHLAAHSLQQTEHVRGCWALDLLIRA